PNGDWDNAKPEALGYPINTEYDEDYPFMHPNGKWLYFSSQGHNSMGGYDIFRAERNPETNSWYKPVNMDFAINSPADDIMFVSDFEEKTAWFASNRNNAKGMLTVYHVMLKRRPVITTIIAGNFRSTPEDPSRKAVITVRNIDNKKIAVVNTIDSTGEYSFNVPSSGGQFYFTVEHSGIHTQTEGVFISPQTEIRTINQRITYEETNGDKKLIIETDFNELVQLDPDFLKNRAALEKTEIVDLGVNTEPVPIGGLSVDPGALEPVGPGVIPSTPKVTTQELITEAKADAQATQEDATSLRQQADRAYAYANNLDKKAKEIQREADKAESAAETLPEGAEKKRLMEVADQLVAESNSLESQTVSAFNTAEALNTDAVLKQDEANKTKEYATLLEKAVKTNDPKMLDKAQRMESELENMTEVRLQSVETAKNLTAEANKKRDELEDAKQTAGELRTEIAQNETKKKELQNQLAITKKSSEKEIIQDQIESVNEEISLARENLVKAEARVERIKQESNALDNQAQAANQTLQHAKDDSQPVLPLSTTEKQSLGSSVTSYVQTFHDPASPTTYAPIDGEIGTPPGTETSAVVTEAGAASTGPVVADNADARFQRDLLALNAIADVVERENAKAKLYTDWAADIDLRVATKDKQFIASNNSAEKDRLQNEISVLKISSADKKQKAKDSLAAAKKAQEALAGGPGPETGPIAIGPATSETGQPVANENVDLRFERDLLALNAITDVVERENAKAKLYTDWATDIDRRVGEKEKQFNASTSFPEKDRLQNEIGALKISSADKKQKAKDSLAAAKKAQEALAGGPGQETGPIAIGPATSEAGQPVVNENADLRFERDLLALNAITDVVERENAKAKLYTDWATDIDRRVGEKEKQFNASTSFPEKDRLQ
ncbi:MAG TPA: hypothetical protein VI731_07230, partial [Bacteroidia bacterium]|nr:hypothetical protein [Bacteroidia bacterium]